MTSRRAVRASTSLPVACSTSSGVGASTTASMSGCGKDRMYWKARCVHGKSRGKRSLTSVLIAKCRAAYTVDADARARAKTITHQGRRVQKSTVRKMGDLSMSLPAVGPACRPAHFKGEEGRPPSLLAKGKLLKKPFGSRV